MSIEKSLLLISLTFDNNLGIDNIFWTIIKFLHFQALLKFPITI